MFSGEERKELIHVRPRRTCRVHVCSLVKAQPFKVLLGGVVLGGAQVHGVAALAQEQHLREQIEDLKARLVQYGDDVDSRL